MFCAKKAEKAQGQIIITVCDKIRQLFSQLLKEEIKIIDRFTKVGKIKGWLNPSPRYG